MTEVKRCQIIKRSWPRECGRDTGEESDDTRGREESEGDGGQDSESLVAVDICQRAPCGAE